MSTRSVSHRSLWVTFVLVSIACFVVYSQNIFGSRPRSLSPQMERVAGLTNEQYEATTDLKMRVVSGKVRAADWSELRSRVLGRSPVAQTLALSSLCHLKDPSDRTKALGLLEELARSTRSDEALHLIVGDVLSFYATNAYEYDSRDGRDLVSRWMPSVADPRLRDLARESVALYDGKKR